MRVLLATGCLLAAIAVPVRAQVPKLAGWSLQFSDDFQGAQRQLPDHSKWIIDTGHGYSGGPVFWGNNERQRYTRHPDNLSLDGHGHLRITPLRDKNGHWTSGRIETRRADFAPPPGGIVRFQARIRMPGVSDKHAVGYWPAFWSIGASYRKHFAWPHAGEFDVMESVNGMDQVWGTLHCGYAPGGPCNEPSGIGQAEPCPDKSCVGQFHTYRFEWDRRHHGDQLRWYVDGKLYHRITRDQLTAKVWNTLTHQRGFFLLLNVAMGGEFPNALAGNIRTPVASTDPGHSMLVDYVGVWTRKD
ncbi:family 16 glycosylhydrolase [Oleiagrimonas sp. C23AA]|nr:glycoside hydrolase family 16 protein [Oleiagrimonas sp. C23AA]NII09521.1 family 16 glycosylhydrolase [Oleiagrimonas sp. C23AA]